MPQFHCRTRPHATRAPFRVISHPSTPAPKTEGVGAIFVDTRPSLPLHYCSLILFSEADIGNSGCGRVISRRGAEARS